MCSKQRLRSKWSHTCVCVLLCVKDRCGAHSCARRGAARSLRIERPSYQTVLPRSLSEWATWILWKIVYQTNLQPTHLRLLLHSDGTVCAICAGPVDEVSTYDAFFKSKVTIYYIRPLLHAKQPSAAYFCSINSTLIVHRSFLVSKMMVQRLCKNTWKIIL